MTNEPIAALFCIFAGSFVHLEHASAAQDSSPEATIRRALMVPLPDGPHLAAKTYDQLFAGATDAKLHELARNLNLSIALQARWELRGSNHPLPTDTSHADYIPGFLEGDAGLHSPMAWAVDFNMRLYHNNTKLMDPLEFYRRAGFVGIRNKMKFTINGKEIWLNTVNLQPDLHRTTYGPLAARNIEITEEAKKVAIRIDGRTIHITPDSFPENGHYRVGVTPDHYIVAAAIDRDKAFVAIAEDAFAPASLECIDLPSERIEWRSAIWAAYAEFSPAMSGCYYYDVQLVCSGESITVFGRGTHCPYYIESFDPRTGENELRFSSNYWDCRRMAVYKFP